MDSTGAILIAAHFVKEFLPLDGEAALSDMTLAFLTGLQTARDYPEWARAIADGSERDTVGPPDEATRRDLDEFMRDHPAVAA